MNVLVTGATGFIGKALVPALIEKGLKVTAWVRDRQRAQACLPEAVELIIDLEQWPEHQGVDLVINLAGAPIVDRRWSESRKELLRNSRISLTEQLVEWLERKHHRPALMLSGSAIGYYGTGCSTEVLTEAAPGAEDFAARLCRDWEVAAATVERQGTRCVLLRTGLVLGVGGGVLQKMLPAFRLGLGGPIGSGRQAFPWIARDDYIAALLFLIDQPDASGPYNLVAPEVVSQAVFAKTLAKLLGRPALLPVPAWLLRSLLGEASALLLTGQAVAPDRLESLGFRFRHPKLQGALSSVLGLSAE